MRRPYLVFSLFILLCLPIAVGVVLADWPWEFEPPAGPLEVIWDAVAYGEFDGALREAERAVRQRPSDTEAHLILALLLQERGDGNRAEGEYRKAFPKAADRPYLETALGQAALAREEWLPAAGHFQAALKSKPDLSQAGLGLAQAQAGGGDRHRATETLRRVVKSNETYPEAFLLLGDLLQAAGAPAADLVALYEQAIEANPGEVDLHLRLARILLKAGQSARAQKEYARVLYLDPANAEARAATT